MTRTPTLLDEDLVRAAQILEETADAIRSNPPATIVSSPFVKGGLGGFLLRIARRFRRVAGKL